MNPYMYEWSSVGKGLYQITAQAVFDLPTAGERLSERDVAPPEPIVAGLLFRGTMAVLGAPLDSYKTNWALQLAVSLAVGMPCYSYSCEKCRVVYFVLEGGEDYILERLEEKIEAMGVDRDDVMSRIHVKDISQKQLDDQKVAKDIEESLMAMKPPPDVVFFDPITYAMNEDVRFSPKKAELCRNMIEIARKIGGVTISAVHCRKGSKNNDDMDDLMGSSIVADAAATRIKLHRQDDLLHMYAWTRHADRPLPTNMVWKAPLLEVIEAHLRPREECKQAVVTALEQKGQQVVLGELVSEVANAVGHSQKTVRSAIDNLKLEGKVLVERVPKRATKLVRLNRPAG